MASKKRQPEQPQPTLRSIFDEMRSHSVILEDMRAQKRATIEAVEATRVVLEQRIDHLEQRLDRLEPRLDRLQQGLDRLEGDTRARDAALELAIRDLKVRVQQNTVDIRELAAQVQVLTRLEERVAALERRGA